MLRYSGFTRPWRVGLSAKILFIRCLMPDSGYQIPDHRIARAAQALAPRVALSFYIMGKVEKRKILTISPGLAIYIADSFLNKWPLAEFT